jgi:hypothetical protein
MVLSGLFVDASAVTAELYSLNVVALVRRHELDAAVAVPVVVTVHKSHHPLARSLLADEWPDWVVGPVLCLFPRRHVSKQL